MTAYEAMLKSKEDAAGIITSFCVAVLGEITHSRQCGLLDGDRCMSYI